MLENPCRGCLHSPFSILHSQFFILNSLAPCPPRYNARGTDARATHPLNPANPFPPVGLRRSSLSPNLHAPARERIRPIRPCPHACATLGNRGKERERNRKVNRQNFPRLWPFSHLGDVISRLMKLAEVVDKPHDSACGRLGGGRRRQPACPSPG